jgi:hypothetical protein
MKIQPRNHHQQKKKHTHITKKLCCVCLLSLFLSLYSIHISSNLTQYTEIRKLIMSNKEDIKDLHPLVLQLTIADQVGFSEKS